VLPICKASKPNIYYLTAACVISFVTLNYIYFTVKVTDVKKCYVTPLQPIIFILMVNMYFYLKPITTQKGNRTMAEEKVPSYSDILRMLNNLIGEILTTQKVHNDAIKYLTD